MSRHVSPYQIPLALSIVCCSLSAILLLSCFSREAQDGFELDKVCDNQPCINPDAHECHCEGNPEGKFDCELTADPPECGVTVFADCIQMEDFECNPFPDSCGYKWECKIQCPDDCDPTPNPCGTTFTNCNSNPI